MQPNPAPRNYGVKKTEAPAVCKKCGLQENDEEKQPRCPRCDWRGHDYTPGMYRKRYTFKQAQQVVRELAPDVWQIIRRLAVQNLLNRGSEEIGSSDVSCVAIEFVQNGDVVIENGRIVRADTGF